MDKKPHWVKVSLPDLDVWRRSWPGNNLAGLDGVAFEFDTNGDLIDLVYDNGDSEQWDGPALLALSQDAQEGKVGFVESHHGDSQPSDHWPVEGRVHDPEI